LQYQHRLQLLLQLLTHQQDKFAAPVNNSLAYYN
jgi:hypothetical protein